ncbi:MAG: dipeptide epimerase, partial [Thermotogota bacterium]|nr:dipeptide epimerase [Thermotogota bacterium]
MKITDLKFEKIKIKLKKPFVISRGATEYCESVLVKITTDEGYYGFGEATPSRSVTGESIDSVTAILPTFKEILIGQDPLSIERIHYILNKAIAGNTAAKAAVDIALYDIKGKVMQEPLYKLLGGFESKVQTDITIGIGAPQEMANEAKERVAGGFNILKIKTGMDLKNDIEAIRLIRKSVGDNVRLKIDANQGWNIHDTLSTIKMMESYNVEAFEQPLADWDLDGSALLRKKSDMKIILDESVHNAHDAMHVIKKDSADMINIKLMKSGGLYEAEKINTIAESAGINCMVGC